MEINLAIGGMTCSSCVSHVDKAQRDLEDRCEGNDRPHCPIIESLSENRSDSSSV